MDIKAVLSVFCMQALSSAVSACDFPNNTATSIHWWPCSNGSLQFSSFTLANVNGTEEYPLDLSKSLVLAADLTNSGETYSRIKNDIDLWLFSGWFHCSWVKLPTFGLLQNDDACAIGIPCPIRPGRQRVHVLLDFTDYAVMTKLLRNDALYQIRYTITNGETGETNCIFMQIRVKSD